MSEVTFISNMNAREKRRILNDLETCIASMIELRAALEKEDWVSVLMHLSTTLHVFQGLTDLSEIGESVEAIEVPDDAEGAR